MMTYVLVRFRKEVVMTNFKVLRAHPASFPMGIEDPSSGGKAAGAS